MTANKNITQKSLDEAVERIIEEMNKVLREKDIKLDRIEGEINFVKQDIRDLKIKTFKT